MTDDVTVIIACYNAERTIGQAVTSALEQSIPTQVIVVDDASTDASPAILDDLAATHTRIQVLRQSANSGPSAARNRAIRIARTTWLATLDADDYMLRDRLQRLVELGRKQQLDFVADDLIRVQPGQDPGTGIRHWKDEKLGVVRLGLAQFVRENISARTGARREIGYLKPLMRTAYLHQHNLFFREDMRLAEDYELYARSLATGAKWAVTDPAGYIAVSQEGSLSRSYPTAAIGTLVAADEALRRMPSLSSDERRAIGEHLGHTRTDFAWRLMIDAVRTRKLSLTARAILQPPPVMFKVLLRSARHVLGLPAIQSMDKEKRSPARDTTDLFLY